ncbi:MAG TPA: hypothetical protein VNJ08_08810 [Bacteriovoracaceae bacterium]|nr:hypothetical protein [Bacteriovoracaceae bacterium]
MNYLMIMLLCLLVGCSLLGGKSSEQGLTKERFLAENGICYKVFTGKDFQQDSGEIICSDKYPRISEGDKVLLLRSPWQKTTIELEKLKTFEIFMASLNDQRAIDYYSFIYFNQRGLIDHKKYNKQWSESCPMDGLSCRLLGYLQKVQGDQSQFFPLMEKGCADYDIISCFNILMRKESLTASDKVKIKKHMKSTCLKVKDSDFYHDFCGELLHGI